MGNLLKDYTSYYYLNSGLQ